MKTKEEVIEIIHKAFQDSAESCLVALPETIDLSQSLADLGFDSVDLVMIVMEMEERLDIEILDDRLTELEGEHNDTVDDMELTILRDFLVTQYYEAHR